MEVLLYILGVVVLVLGLALSIGLHELGHLIPAKLFKVKVTQYMIGFGRTLWKKRKGETEYGIKMLPLGGYISMIGMYPPAHSGEEARESTTGFLNSVATEGSRVVKNRPGESGHDDAVHALRDALDADPQLAETLRPEALHVDPDPAKTDAADIVVEGKDSSQRANYFVSMVNEAREVSSESIGDESHNRAFYKLPVWKRIVIMLGGPFMNLLLAVVFYTIFLVGFGLPQSTTTIGSVSECLVPATSSVTSCAPGDAEAPGAQAGLRPGDRIVSINGERITEWQQIQDTVSVSPSRALSVVVEREGSEVDLSITPALNARAVLDAAGQPEMDAAGNPVTAEVGMIGVSPTSELVRQPVTSVLPQVGNNIELMAQSIINLPSRMVNVWNAAFGTEERDPTGPVGVVGVGRMAGEIASLDTIPVAVKIQGMVGLLASLNVALFVFNLIPLMPLDGGHVAGALYEKVRRTIAKIFGRPDPGPVDTAKMVPVTFAVVIVLGAMTLLLFYADIVRPISLLG
ncbi:site-2 protease family protein [Lysinibacter sp. HNR]|uniref:M50 family metallopeptidase n=1 Tax=Lysinibacter sp. HNR TaxID=3031408 RepID=UPI002434CC0B|nr:site-2 protease family protein [Lysinibacter sp. HNR]WGD37979.1 site-2 protease family protein [Lysinibacter sp. HNR]